MLCPESRMGAKGHEVGDWWIEEWQMWGEGGCRAYERMSLL